MATPDKQQLRMAHAQTNPATTLEFQQGAQGTRTLARSNKWD